MKNPLLKNQSGFNYLEIIVAVGIFAGIMAAAGGIFQAIIAGQRNAIAAQNIQDAFRFGMEVMSKESRSAQKDNGVCDKDPVDVPDTQVYGQNSGADLIFKNKHGQCVRYYLSAGRIYIDREKESFPITPAGITVTSLRYVINQALSVQPSVMIFIDGYVQGQAAQKEEIKIQTSISSRYYE